MGHAPPGTWQAQHMRALCCCRCWGTCAKLAAATLACGGPHRCRLAALLALSKRGRDCALGQTPAELVALKADVEAYAMQFPTIGFEKGTMRYKS